MKRTIIEGFLFSLICVICIVAGYLHGKAEVKSILEDSVNTTIDAQDDEVWWEYRQD